MQVEITIIGARSILAADIGGTSDGYVKFSTSGTKQQKTKVAKPSLNPMWNEKFNCVVQPNEEIKFEVFDHDTFSKDDPLGDAKVIVPPMCTGEFWVDCLPISKKGYLYIGIQCKQGHPPGTLFRPFNPQSDMVIRMEITAITHLLKLNEIRNCKIEVQVENEKEQTSDLLTFQRNNNIKQSFYVRCKPGQKIEIKVVEPGLVGKSTIDKGKYIVADMREREMIDEFIPMKKGSTITCRVDCVRSVYHNVIPQQIPPEGDYAQVPEIPLNIFFEKANKIKAADLGGTSDAYIVFKTNRSKEKKTYIYDPSVNPCWQQALNAKAYFGEEIRFNLFDHDTLSKDDPLGGACWTVEPLRDCQWKPLVLPIDKKGELHLRVKRVRGVSETYKR